MRGVTFFTGRTQGRPQTLGGSNPSYHARRCRRQAAVVLAWSNQQPSGDRDLDRQLGEERSYRIHQLRAALESAVRAEEYEEAAAIRDQLLQLSPTARAAADIKLVRQSLERAVIKEHYQEAAWWRDQLQQLLEQQEEQAGLDPQRAQQGDGGEADARAGRGFVEQELRLLAQMQAEQEELMGQQGTELVEPLGGWDSDEWPPTTHSEAVTNGIRVVASSVFLPSQSCPFGTRYVFAYTVRIANEGPSTVRVANRYWLITDAEGNVQEVSGPGVVGGKRPVLAPGEAFEFSAVCPLSTPVGSIEGHFEILTRSAGVEGAWGWPFEAVVGRFGLSIAERGMGSAQQSGY